jgi:hypothetical protein
MLSPLKYLDGNRELDHLERNWRFMKMVKLVVISAVILFLLVTALSLLLPSRVRISRAMDIPVAKEKILPFISNLEQWKKWNRFVIVADSMHELGENSPTAIQAGDLRITLQISEGDSIATNWVQNQNGSGAHIVCIGGKGYTTVQWYFDFHLKWYPWQKFQSIVYDKQLGPEMEASLENLRRIVQ